jgi:hypothetical protein
MTATILHLHLLLVALGTLICALMLLLLLKRWVTPEQAAHPTRVGGVLAAKVEAAVGETDRQRKRERRERMQR